MTTSACLATSHSGKHRTIARVAASEEAVANTTRRRTSSGADCWEAVVVTCCYTVARLERPYESGWKHMHREGSRRSTSHRLVPAMDFGYRVWNRTPNNPWKHSWIQVADRTSMIANRCFRRGSWYCHLYSDAMRNDHRRRFGCLDMRCLSP